MGAKKEKPALTAYEQAIADITPFVSTDAARTMIAQPVGTQMGAGGKGWIVGSDGHRVHGVECKDWEKAWDADRARFVSHVLPTNALLVGEIWFKGADGANVAGLRELPSKWESYIEFRSDAAILTCSITRRVQKKNERVEIVPRARLELGFKLANLPDPKGIAACYLLDAIDFCGTNLVSVYTDQNDNWVFAPGSKAPLEADRFAVVCPVRI